MGKGREYGLLTEKQYIVLKLRMQGYTQEEIAKLLHTSRESISIIEKRARENIKLAEKTLKVYRELMKAGEIIVEPGTHLVDIPVMLVRKADEVGVKLKANFNIVYDEIRFNARDCVYKTRVVKPIRIVLFKDGSFSVEKL